LPAPQAPPRTVPPSYPRPPTGTLLHPPIPVLASSQELDVISNEIEDAAKQADERAAAEAAAEEAEAQQQLADGAATVYLVGHTPGGVHWDYLGAYEREPELVNGRMAYAMAGDPSKMLWFSRTNGYWHAGPRANLGSPRGWLAVFDRSALPERVTAEWQVGAANGGLWTPAPEVRCLAGMAGAAAHAAMGQDEAVPAELEGAAAVVYLVGPTAPGVNRKYIGAYGRGSQIVNGRYIYSRIGQGGDPMRMLWYCDGGDSPGQWWAGPKGNLGCPAGWLAVHDSALTPETITASWRAIPRGGAGWLELPGLRCAAGEDGERLHLEEVEAHRAHEAEEAERLLRAAAKRVHLVGVTPDGVHSDYLGAYDREPGLVNGRPAYAMTGTGDKMLWFSSLNGYWHAGPRSNLGGSRGWLAVYDLAPLPERVTGQWQVGAVDSSWTAAPDVRCLAADATGREEEHEARAGQQERRARDDEVRPARSRRR
jgi:hypothetical protein